jgi:hypothetical protein
MRWYAYLLLAGIVVAGTATDSDAQIFGPKKNKTTPQQRVPELLVIVQQDKDGHKRADAAEELRQYDPAQFPEIVPVLVDVLQSDPTAAVRIEAATSLGRMRPISVQAGQALEKACASDSNLRVRIQARTSLTYYQLSGYHAPKTKDAGKGPDLNKGPSTNEPPLGVGQEWLKNGQTPPPNAPTSYRPLPSGPPPASKQVPVVTGPPQTPPPPLPSVETNPPPLHPTPEPAWVPAKVEGPTLTPPR